MFRKAAPMLWRHNTLRANGVGRVPVRPPAHIAGGRSLYHPSFKGPITKDNFHEFYLTCPIFPVAFRPYDKLLSQDPHKWKDSMPESLQAKPLASLDDAETSVPGNVYYHIARPI